MELASAVRRRIQASIQEDLSDKMVFVAGPRQCGKTTLARQVAATAGSSAYFNWDVAAHRKQLRQDQIPDDARLWVFDELHKSRSWRSWLKGVYDLHHERHSILVTGSARLEVYGRGGDSLQGRYFLHRLHPFTLSEVCALPVADDLDELARMERQVPVAARDTLESLLRFGGFPEPFLKGSDRWANRWRSAYGDRLVREDIRDLENLRDLDRVELLFDRLPATVGSVLSLNSLREDLEVAFDTLKSWVAVLERTCAVFRIPPYGAPRIKAVKKSPKLYFWDWARVESDAARLENLVVCHLQRLVHWIQDVHGEKAELRFFRDVVGHETDAVVLRRGKPWMAVEVKTSDRPVDPGLRYFLERVRIPYAYQLSLAGTVDTRSADIGASSVRLLPAWKFLAQLP